MDSLITAAARALAAGDPFGALNRVALREDAAALALRGIAMAQLGDLLKAKTLLRQAARAFGKREPAARARCIVAEAEVALAARDLQWPEKALQSARETLERTGDPANAAHATYLEAKRLLLLGRLREAEGRIGHIDPAHFPAPLRTAHELLVAGVAMRRMHAKAVRAALARARTAAGQARIPALTAEVENSARILSAPAARLLAGGTERVLMLDEVETVLASKALVIDECRNLVKKERVLVPLAGRPVLFALARALGEAWPEDVRREQLLARAFGARLADESHRARLRVEIGRLRKALRGIADIQATERGFVLTHNGEKGEVAILAPPVAEEHAEVLALLADGESWSSSALALALAVSQRTVQRALDGLAAAGKAQAIGKGRARRWMSPLPGSFTTTLLLTMTVSSD